MMEKQSREPQLWLAASAGMLAISAASFIASDVYRLEQLFMQGFGGLAYPGAVSIIHGEPVPTALRHTELSPAPQQAENAALTKADYLHDLGYVLLGSGLGAVGGAGLAWNRQRSARQAVPEHYDTYALSYEDRRAFEQIEAQYSER